MTHATTARTAGSAFLVYIVAGITTMGMSGGAPAEPNIARRIAAIAAQAPQLRLAILLDFVGIMCALVLGVTLYNLTRAVDSDLAILALCCRVCEGLLGALPILATLCLLELSQTHAAVSAPAELLFRVKGWNTLISATFFAVGSTIFSVLFLRGRVIPSPLAALGIVASILLVAGLPLQLAGFLRGATTSLMWLPMLLFEVPLAFWLLVKGARTTAPAVLS